MGILRPLPDPLSQGSGVKRGNLWSNSILRYSDAP